MQARPSASPPRQRRPSAARLTPSTRDSASAVPADGGARVPSQRHAGAPHAPGRTPRPGKKPTPFQQLHYPSQRHVYWQAANPSVYNGRCHLHICLSADRGRIYYAKNPVRFTDRHSIPCHGTGLGPRRRILGHLLGSPPKQVIQDIGTIPQPACPEGKGHSCPSGFFHRPGYPGFKYFTSSFNALR